MNLERLQFLIEQPTELKLSDEALLDEALEKYPYFQAIYALKLKLLANNNSFRFNQFLRKTATRTTHRAVLFEFITSKEFKQHQIVEKINLNHMQSDLEQALGITTQEAEIIKSPDLFQKKEPLEFTHKDKQSFSEWVSYLKIAPVKSAKNQPDKIDLEFKNPKVEKQKQVIDNFINENPKIKPAKTLEKRDKTLELKSKPSQMMTETLANVYLEQKRYDKAIQAFKILILKSPEKSSLFANRINEIKQIKENNI